jgi:hypothetical protein
MIKLLKPVIGFLAVSICLSTFSAELSPGLNISEQKKAVQNGDWASVIQKALKNAADEQIIFFPKSEYKTKSPLIYDAPS